MTSMQLIACIVLPQVSDHLSNQVRRHRNWVFSELAIRVPFNSRIQHERSELEVQGWTWWICVELARQVHAILSRNEHKMRWRRTRWLVKWWSVIYKRSCSIKMSIRLRMLTGKSKIDDRVDACWDRKRKMVKRWLTELSNGHSIANTPFARVPNLLYLYIFRIILFWR